jgi:hypothetical protein
LFAQPDKILPFLLGIEGALFSDHQEPCLILDARCLPPPSFEEGVVWGYKPAPPFEVNHANCISDISVPICGPLLERCIHIKGSNFDNVTEVSVSLNRGGICAAQMIANLKARRWHPGQF